MRAAALILALLLAGCTAGGDVDVGKVCEVTITVAQAILSNCK